MHNKPIDDEDINPNTMLAQRWEFMKENKKTHFRPRKRPRKKERKKTRSGPRKRP